MLLLNPRRTRTNMKLLQLVWIFLLTLCGQSGITAMTVKEDDDVILDCSIGATSTENKKFDWVKFVDQEKTDVFFYADNKPQPGPQFGNRVTHFPEQLQFGNASIKITKAKTSDSGTYTCYHAIVRKEIKSNISLTVGASPRPIVTANKTNNGVLLKCEVLGSSPEPAVEWWDNEGNVLPADKLPIKPQPGNKYDVILNVVVIKAGFYRCVATQKKINHQIYTETYVPGPGGASEPSVTILENTKDGVLLQCVVRGASPELKVSWKTKAGHLVPSKEPQKTEKGGGYDIILQTTVTKTDYYRCVTTEGKKDDEVYSEIYVTVPDEISRSTIGVSVALVVVLTVAAVFGVLYFLQHRRLHSIMRGPTPTPAASRQQQRGNSLTDVQSHLFTSG